MQRQANLLQAMEQPQSNGPKPSRAPCGTEIQVGQTWYVWMRPVRNIVWAGAPKDPPERVRATVRALHPATVGLMVGHWYVEAEQGVREPVRVTLPPEAFESLLLDVQPVDYYPAWRCSPEQIARAEEIFADERRRTAAMYAEHPEWFKSTPGLKRLLSRL